MMEPDALGLRVSPLTWLAWPTPTTAVPLSTLPPHANGQPHPDVAGATGQPRTQPAQIIGNLKPRLKISKCACSYATGPSWPTERATISAAPSISPLPTPPITSAVRLATTNTTVGSTYSNKLNVPPHKLPSPPPPYPVPQPFDARWGAARGRGGHFEAIFRAG